LTGVAGRLIVLIDGGCASASEYFVLPFKVSGRATIVGERTAGSTGQPYLYVFPNGISFRVSAKRVSFPDGSRFEGVGSLAATPLNCLRDATDAPPAVDNPDVFALFSPGSALLLLHAAPRSHFTMIEPMDRLTAAPVRRSRIERKVDAPAMAAGGGTKVGR